jgi:hypothetical protein
LSKQRASVDDDDQGRHKLFTCVAKDKDGPRQVALRIYSSNPKGLMKSDHRAWVHCDCPYFKYYVEVAVAARGSSTVLTSNGQFPKIRNPRMTPYLCKHLVAAVKPALRMKPKKTSLRRIDDIDRLVAMLAPYIPG